MTAPEAAMSPAPDAAVEHRRSAAGDHAGGEHALVGATGLPAPEPKGRRAVIRATALVAIVATAAYLGWRIGFTVRQSLWLAIPLWLLELHALVGLGLFTFSLWDLDAAPRPPPRAARRAVSDLRVALLIPTYDEPSEVLLPTVAAAVSLSPAHETWVLDDDHVPASGFLEHTLGYFADPRVAVVQTPQEFYNVDSFEHRRRLLAARGERPDGERLFGEQRLFYRAIQPGKNRWDAAFWCGTSALVRVEALREVGGVAEETVTEDIHTTIRMQRRGWRTVYHDEVLARGLAARNAEEYFTQRLRWGTGAMQVLHAEHPITGRGLGFAQRLAYASTLLG